MNSYLEVNIQLKDLAHHLQCEYTGKAETLIKYIGDLNSVVDRNGACQHHCIYFARNENIVEKISGNTAECVILAEKKIANQFENCIITGNRPQLDFINLLKYFDSKTVTSVNEKSMIHPSARISKTAVIAPGVYIGEGAIVEENCRIYANAVIEPFAVISRNSVIHSGVFVGKYCAIGSDCIVFPNAVIGSDGFGYMDEDGVRYKIPQIGNVVLGNSVEIGSCTTIDRSTIESTTIGDNTKIDNQVQIAHNCKIGKNVYIAGKASLAGSVKVRDNAILAGGCGIRDHVCIAESSVILAFTGVEEDTEPHQTYFGIPARKVREMHRINSALTHLPELVKASRHLFKE